MWSGIHNKYNSAEKGLPKRPGEKQRREKHIACQNKNKSTKTKADTGKEIHINGRVQDANVVKVDPLLSTWLKNEKSYPSQNGNQYSNGGL